MKNLSIEILDTGEIFDVEICQGTTPLDILEALGLDRYQLGRKVEEDGFRTFGEEVDIYEEVIDQDELVSFPKSDIDPPFHPEKNITVVEADNGRVHQISIKQGDTLERILESLGLGSGVLYQERSSNVAFTNFTQPFEDLQEGETLTFFILSELPALIQNHLRGGD